MHFAQFTPQPKGCHVAVYGDICTSRMWRAFSDSLACVDVWRQDNYAWAE
jgi:hypothetical protein